MRELMNNQNRTAHSFAAAMTTTVAAAVVSVFFFYCNVDDWLRNIKQQSWISTDLSEYAAVQHVWLHFIRTTQVNDDCVLYYSFAVVERYKHTFTISKTSSISYDLTLEILKRCSEERNYAEAYNAPRLTRTKMLCEFY